MCKNNVIQYVERKFETKEIVSKCGSTGQYGVVLLCDSCKEKAETRYPQGWRDVPGDTCRHGNYVGGGFGPDHICGLCE